jgi:hypothetical protein
VERANFPSREAGHEEQAAERVQGSQLPAFVVAIEDKVVNGLSRLPRLVMRRSVLHVLPDVVDARCGKGYGKEDRRAFVGGVEEVAPVDCVALVHVSPFAHTVGVRETCHIFRPTC